MDNGGYWTISMLLARLYMADEKFAADVLCVCMCVCVDKWAKYQ